MKEDTNMSKENLAATEELVEVQNTAALATQADVPLGFEDEDAGDMFIPRVKFLQTLRPVS